MIDKQRQRKDWHMKKVLFLTVLFLACGVVIGYNISHSAEFGQSVFLATAEAPAIQAALNDVAESLCRENGSVWQDVSNAVWLAENIGGYASEWRYEDEKWVYEYDYHTHGGYQKWADWFEYPDFGTFVVYLYAGGSIIVDKNNPRVLFTERFTKLEFYCP